MLSPRNSLKQVLESERSPRSALASIEEASLGAGVVRNFDRECFAIVSAANVLSAIPVFGVNPRYAIDDQQPLNVIAGRAAALDDSPLGPAPSL
jgi:hypothetical protein